MHRMTQPKSNKTLVAAVALAVLACVGIRQAGAQPPSVVHADMDYEASGYVVPAGMVPPAMYSGDVMPVGFFGGCDSGCDSPVACDSGGCGMACGGRRCGVLGCGGLLGKLSGEASACGGCGMSGCGACGGLSNLRHICMFCRGDGCSFCQTLGRGYLLGALSYLKPYDRQGICAQRWYDLSAEAIFLGHGNGGVVGPTTTRGAAPGVAGDAVPANIIVLRREDADAGDSLEAGARLSASMIWGAGGNLEVTYIGGHQWQDRAFVADANPVFFSFVSDFGRNPINGFDDTDRSILQSVEAESEFHSAELNYRRRTVGPYCRFQGSWLVGLRYVRYDHNFIYQALGEFDNAVNANLPRFFSSNDKRKNNLFGPQAGFDLWWNAHAGINLGIGFKGAWVQNDYDRITTLTANSLNPVATPGTQTVTASDRKGTVMGEFEAKLIYRLSHSLALRSSYYALAVDDITFGNTDAQTIADFVSANPLTASQFQFNSLVIQGVSFGAEYTW